jgi:hypothetical protein
MTLQGARERLLGRVFNSRCSALNYVIQLHLQQKQPNLKVENSAQTAFRLFPVGFCAPRTFSPEWSRMESPAWGTRGPQPGRLSPRLVNP